MACGCGDGDPCTQDVCECADPPACGDSALFRALGDRIIPRLPRGGGSYTQNEDAIGRYKVDTKKLREGLAAPRGVCYFDGPQAPRSGSLRPHDAPRGHFFVYAAPRCFGSRSFAGHPKFYGELEWAIRWLMGVDLDVFSTLSRNVRCKR